MQWLLIASGPITAIPLQLFAAGARRIPLSLLGIWLHHEPFDNARLIGFALIWSALAVYSLEGLWSNRSARSRPAP